jgi:hypothetical protein
MLHRSNIVLFIFHVVYRVCGPGILIFEFIQNILPVLCKRGRLALF